MLKIVLQINYWKTKYKPQAQHSIKCPLFSAVKCSITEKIKDHFHKSSNTDDQNRHMSQFSVNFTGAKHCKVFLFTFFGVFSIIENKFSPTKGSENFGHRYLRLCGTSIWFYPLVYSIFMRLYNRKLWQKFFFIGGSEIVLLLTEWEK